MGKFQVFIFKLIFLFSPLAYTFALDKYCLFTNFIPSNNILWNLKINNKCNKTIFSSLYTSYDWLRYEYTCIYMDSKVIELFLNAYGLLKAQSHTHQWKNSSSSSQFRAFYIVKQWRSDKFLTEDKMFSFWFCSKPAGYLIWSVIHQEQQEEVQKKMILLV